jgi:hypothetical protein
MEDIVGFAPPHALLQILILALEPLDGRREGVVGLPSNDVEELISIDAAVFFC